ncbi:MAG: hypothetical protein ACYDBP_05380 [Leptospirales bacterium]
MSAPGPVVPEYVKKLYKYADLEYIGRTDDGGMILRGDCPVCRVRRGFGGVGTLIVTHFVRSPEKKILFSCLAEKTREHRKSILDIFRKDGIQLSGYSPVPVTELPLAEYPFFSLSTKKDTSTKVIDYGGHKIELFPSSIGHPTMGDEPLYLFSVKLAKDIHSRTGSVPAWVEYRSREYLEWIGARDKELSGSMAASPHSSLLLKGEAIFSDV